MYTCQTSPKEMKVCFSLYLPSPKGDVKNQGQSYKHLPSPKGDVKNKGQSY